MPKWTKEQQLAIDESGKNIIVSAGAGSGKTAVLTERVIQKLKKGESIDKLLILTFTNAAAKEMKERIRASIKKNNLLTELDKIDSSYITTFDSFSLSIVKKYHYLLNINKDVKIADNLILKWNTKQKLDDIFLEMYEKENEKFLKLIKDFTVRDDSKIKNYILNMYNKISLKYDFLEYLDSYLDKFYDISYLDKLVLEYENILLKKIDEIKTNLDELELITDGTFYYSMYSSLEKLLNSKTYDDIKNNLDISLPRLKKGMESEKPFKEKISNIISSLGKLTIYESREYIYESILNTKDYVSIIISILKELDKRVVKFKKENELYDFLDISKLAIKVVLEHDFIKLELTNSFHEILVDEYQDTSDLQELFISLISNNNVYMVGDIKQSIYRFRNANPNLFKEKYVSYQQGINGMKIDLVKNFRSREETLNNINYIFNYIMDLDLGGADYKNGHQMVFGNTLYDEFKKQDQDSNFSIYSYNLENKTYSKDEVEAFITVFDIKEKVKNKYQVFDKDKQQLRDITYDDFVILIDKSTSFSLYKQIFEYNNVPLTILKDEDISGSYDLYILKNIFILIDCIKTNTYDTFFKYSYLSLGRSYLFNLDDSYLYERITSNNYLGDEIITIIKEIVKDDYLPTNLIIDKIIEKFNFLEKLIMVGNIQDALIRLDYLRDLSHNLGEMGYTYKDFLNYLTKMIENKDQIKYSLNKESKNSVKIMTIHKSKGLEYHICYYTGLTNKFNTSDLKERFIYSNKLGFITPTIYNNSLLNTILYTLYKIDYLKEDISERIRLLYVALTRAKEKMILITTFKESEESFEDIVSLDTRLKYNSFASILNSIQDKLTDYIKPVDLNNYNLTKNYLSYNASNILNKIEKTSNKLDVLELNINYNILENKKFSKTNYELLTKDTKEKLEFGEHLHYLLETIDFLNPDLTMIDNKYKKYLINFFNSKLLSNLNNTSIYKEYEFSYEDNNTTKHGIIDLMIEHDTYIDIIDYKLKNLSDDKYKEQLLGYKDYIKTKTNKNINLYLYSIIDGVYLQIE